MKLAASAVTLLALCGLAQLIFGGGYSEELKLFDYFKQDAVSGKGGGIVGGVLVTVLCSTVGTIGAYLILLVLFAIGVVCITEKSLVGAVRRGSGRAYRYAKDDMNRRREIYEERRKREEKNASASGRREPEALTWMPRRWENIPMRILMTIPARIYMKIPEEIPVEDTEKTP